MKVFILMTTTLPTDQQVVDAIQMKHHLFTTKFCKNKMSNWSATDHMYFKHMCTVLKHAEAMFRVDLDALIDKQIKIQEDE